MAGRFEQELQRRTQPAASANRFEAELQRRDGQSQLQGAVSSSQLGRALQAAETQMPDIDPQRVAQSAQRALARNRLDERFQPSPLQNALQTGFEEFINNALAIPQGLGEFAAIGGAGFETAVGSLAGQEGGFGERFQKNLQQQRETLPASALVNLPRPTVADIAAGVQAPFRAAGNILQGEAPNISGEFQQGQLEQQQRLQQQLESPGGTIGDIGADIATLVTGRAPFAAGRARNLQQARETAEKQFIRSEFDIPLDVKRQFQDVLSDNLGAFSAETSKFLRDTIKRSGEAGLETMALAILNDDDPVASAALGAGAQAGGQLGLKFIEKFIDKPAGTLGAAFLASYLWNAVGPDERDVFESFEFSTDKAIIAAALGTIGAVIGAGRLRNETAEQLPKFMDAITAVPRGIVQNRLRELTEQEKAGNTAPFRTMQILATDPDRFSKNQLNALSRAINSEKAGAFSKEVNRLMEVENFRDRLNQPEKPVNLDKIFQSIRGEFEEIPTFVPGQ